MHRCRTSPRMKASLFRRRDPMTLFLTCAFLAILALVSRSAPTSAFAPVNRLQLHSLTSYKEATSTILFSSPPPRQPRRMLKKRRSRQRQGKSLTPAQQFPWETAESRPLVKSVSKEAGEDYWIDEQELKDFNQQQEAIKNRKALEGEIPPQKLWSEVKAPYKQNWIGYFSVFVFILSAIIIKFPELLDQPTISFPDL